MESVHDAKRLAELQALPLSRKVQITQARIIEWYQHYNGNVCVSFSGGKDSTALLHLVRQLYPGVKAVFSNTGLEYPEIQRFVKSFDNVDVVTPKMRFDEVISTYGYPLISKEVAEAIYYARRIRSQDVNKEQTNSPDRADAGIRNGSGVVVKPLTNGGVLRDQPKKGRPPSSRKWEDYHRTILAPDWDNPRSREINWIRRAGIARTGQTGEGGVFSNPEEQFGEKSQFNKEKYLPLCKLPIPISHYCCQKMKKQPMKAYQHKYGLYPILGTLAEESRVRKQGWIRHGCNAFESKSPSSQPLSFWTEQDILCYLIKNDIEIASVYGDICAVDGDGIAYNRESTNFMLNFGLPCKLHCTGCDRTGQINAAA